MPRPSTGAVATTVRLTPDKLAAVDAAAEDTGQSRGDWLRGAIDHALAGCGVPGRPGDTQERESEPAPPKPRGTSPSAAGSASARGARRLADRQVEPNWKRR